MVINWHIPYTLVMEFVSLLGLRIKYLRETMGYTQDELSEIIEISPSTIARIENGHKFMHPKTITKFKEALKVSYGELFDIEACEKNKQIEDLTDKTINKLKKLDSKGLTFISAVLENYLKTH